MIGRIVAVVAVVIARARRPSRSCSTSTRRFQYIQDFTGFVTPGICVIFLLGLFWERTTATAAMVAALVTVVMSAAFYIWLPDYPFMNRVGWCFVVGMVVAVVIPAQARDEVDADVEAVEVLVDVEHVRLDGALPPGERRVGAHRDRRRQPSARR